MISRPLNDLSFAELQVLLGPQAHEQEARKVLAALYRPGDGPAIGEALGVRRIVLDRAREGRLARLEVVERRRAADGFLKYLFRSPLGGEFEAVRIPVFETKHVVCVSSQVGCALGCAFCHTGRLGFTRNLETWEMVEQVRIIRDEAQRPVRHVVFMGMGEPLLNYDQVLRAAHLLCEPGGLQVSGRNITLSTAGVVPAIRRYVAEGHTFRLAFSVTSADPDKRARLMPIERRWPLSDLVEAIREYCARRRERAMIAYVMMAGVNTGREDVEALARAFAGVPIKLDLIDVADPSGLYRPPDSEELNRFRDELQSLKAPVARRYSGGLEIGAACGTLAATRRGGTVLPAP
ncbi:MAG: radical SAM protein [Deltaproteobacteria bacterium]|nr:radical SAM protein [Deltaproteobacteria bacterium]